MLLSSKPSMITQSLALTNPKINPMSISTTTTTTTTIKSMINDRSSQRRPRLSALEARVSLVFALAAQTSALSQRLLMELATETAKYVNPKRFESRNLEEALMAVPDLETVEFKVLSRRDQYEIREVEEAFQQVDNSDFQHLLQVDNCEHLLPQEAFYNSDKDVMPS